MPPWFVLSTAKTSVERRIAEIINCFTIHYPYTTGLLLLYFGAEPLLFCFFKGIFVIWGSFLYLFGFEKPRVNRDGLASQSQRNYGTTTLDTHGDSSYLAYLEAAGARYPSNIYEEGAVKQVAVRVIMGVVFRVWGLYILGREWRWW